MKRLHRVAVWLAIAALLIGSLLPAAVSAAVPADGAAPPAWCGAAGAPFPAGPAPSLAARHCALCGVFVALLSPAPGSPTIRTDTARFGLAPLLAAAGARQDYPAAQPRAPPRFAS